MSPGTIHDVEPRCPSCRRVSWWNWCDYCEVPAVVHCTECGVKVELCSSAPSGLRVNEASRIDEKRVRIAAGLHLVSITKVGSAFTGPGSLSVLKTAWSNKRDALAPLIGLSMRVDGRDTRLVKEAAAHVLGLRSTAVASTLSESAQRRLHGLAVDTDAQMDPRWPGVLAAAVRFRTRSADARHLGPLESELFAIVLERSGIEPRTERTAPHLPTIVTS